MEETINENSRDRIKNLRKEVDAASDNLILARKRLRDAKNALLAACVEEQKEISRIAGFEGIIPSALPVDLVDVPETNVKVPAKIFNGSMLQAFDVVKDDPGEFYFMPDENNFAICIAGTVLFGSIGKILSSSSIKTQECKSCSQYMVGYCNHYHSPLYYPGYKDIRNFKYDDMTYIRAVNNNVQSHSHGINFGSGPTLHNEIEALTDGEKRKIRALVMHYLLATVAIDVPQQALFSSTAQYGKLLGAKDHSFHVI